MPAYPAALKETFWVFPPAVELCVWPKFSPRIGHSPGPYPSINVVIAIPETGDIRILSNIQMEKYEKSFFATCNFAYGFLPFWREFRRDWNYSSLEDIVTKPWELRVLVVCSKTSFHKCTAVGDWRKSIRYINSMPLEPCQKSACAQKNNLGLHWIEGWKFWYLHCQVNSQLKRRRVRSMFVGRSVSFYSHKIGPELSSFLKAPLGTMQNFNLNCSYVVSCLAFQVQGFLSRLLQF